MIDESDIVPEIASRLNGAGDGADSETLMGALGAVPDAEVAALVARARRHLQEDRAERAEILAFMAGVLAPTDADVRDCVTRVFGHDGVNGVNAHLLGVVREPADRAARRDLGSALRRDDRLGAAAAVYRGLLHDDPRDGESWRNLAAVLRDAAETDAALIVARHLVGLRPNDGWAHIQHANILARMERPADAIRAYELALEHEPEAPVVRAAVARQAVKLGDQAKAMRFFRLALHDDPGDWHAADGLATALQAAGQHAEALVWRRRIQEMRPQSSTARRKLADALLRREHLGAARGILAALEASDDPGATPLWDGRPANGTVALYHRRADPPARTLLGMAAARRLAEAGHILLCSLPARLAELMAEPPPSLGIVEDDANGARNGAFGNAVTAYLPLADAVLLADPHLPAAAPWLTAPDGDRRQQIGRVAFISAADPATAGINIDAVRAHVTEYFDVRAVYAPARPGIDKTVAAMKGIDFVITDDPLTALAAAGTGLPSCAVLPAQSDWWWFDRGDASPWSACQTLIRVTPDMDPDAVFAAVRGAIETSGVAPPFDPPLRPDTGPQVLIETVERLSGLFRAGRGRILPVRKLTGGTRNAVYRLGEGDDCRVLRLGRFPPPRKHFYAKESANMRLAAEAGLAPRVDFTDSLDGSMLIDFVDGEIMRSKNIREAANAIAIARLYRRLHQLPGFRDRFDIFEKIERNVRRLQRAGADSFAEQETFNALMVRVAGILRANGVPHYATHNDPLTRNFIRDGDRMLIIDWECSGLGDPHWEVAALSAQAGLDEDVWQAYVTTYFGSDGHPAICRIPLFEAACRYFWWTDALCSGIKRPDGNAWRDKSERWWNWFTDVVGAKGFDKAVAAAEDYRWELSHSPASTHFDAED